jgi:hypothetical protein
MLNCYSGIEPQSAGQCKPSDDYAVTVLSFPGSADHPFCRMSRSWWREDCRRHLHATTLLLLLQLSSRDSEMSGASFTACATQPISFYEASVRYLQVGEPTTFYWLGIKVQIVEVGDVRLEGIQKRLGVYRGAFHEDAHCPAKI